MALVQVADLSDELCDNELARRCVIDGEHFVSAYDIMGEFSTQKDIPAAWERFVTDFPEIDTGNQKHHIGRGGGTHGTPMIKYHVALEVICRLEGKNARKWQAASADALIHLIDPTEEFVDDLRNRANDIGSGLIPKPRLTHRTTKSAITSTNKAVYVRIALPEEFRDANAVCEKGALSLNNDIMKFGVSKDEKDRERGYFGDNGHYLYSFECREHHHADLPERILVNDLRGVVVNGRKEYVHTAGVAAMMGLTYDGSYASYIKIAMTLFVAFVQRVKALWPSIYQGEYGLLYELKLSTVAKSHARRPVTQEVADQMGIGTFVEFINEDMREFIASESRKTGADEGIECISNDVASSDVQIADDPGLEAVSSSDTEGVRDTDDDKGCDIICRNIETGAETIFRTIKDASQEIGISSKLLRDTYLDKNLQIFGHSYRTDPNALWVPPEGLVFIVDMNIRQTGRFIVAVSEHGDRRVYESPVIASMFVRGCQERTLRAHIDDGKLYAGWKWNHLDTKSMNEICTPDQAARLDRKVFPVKYCDRVTIADEQPIIARSLVSGEETLFDDWKSVMERFRSIEKHESTHLINQPSQTCLYTFRSARSEMRFEFHPAFKPRSSGRRGGKACVAENSEGIVGMFENVQGAAEHIVQVGKFAAYNTNISNAIKNGKICYGYTWRHIDQLLGDFVRVDDTSTNSLDQHVVPVFCPVAPIKPDIVQRDLITGEVTMRHTSISSAAKVVEAKHGTMEKAILGKHRQAKGFSFRHANSPQALFPDGFTWFADVREEPKKGVYGLFKVLLTDGSPRVFESRISAERFQRHVSCSDPEPFEEMEFIPADAPYPMDNTMYRVAESELAAAASAAAAAAANDVQIPPNRPATRAETAATSKKPERTGKHGRRPVVVRDLRTGEETRYNFRSGAAAKLKCNDHTVQNITGTARACNGYHCRFDGPEYPHWVPPERFVTKTGELEKKTDGLVNVTCADGLERAFESKAAAIKYTSFSKNTIETKQAEDCGYWCYDHTPRVNNTITIITKDTEVDEGTLASSSE